MMCKMKGDEVASSEKKTKEKGSIGSFFKKIKEFGGKNVGEAG